MFDLFKFVLLRPSKDIAGDAVINIDISETAFGEELAVALKTSAPLQTLHDIAKTFMTTKPAFVKTTDSLKLAAGLQSFYSSVAGKRTIPLADLSGDISVSFHQQSPAVLSQSGDFLADKSRIFQSIVALRLLPDNSPLISQLARMACLLNIIDRVAKKDETLAAANGVQSALEATIQLPDNIFPLPPGKDVNQPLPAGNTDTANSTDVKDTIVGLTEIYTALTNAQPSDVNNTQLVDPQLPSKNFTIKRTSFFSLFSGNKPEAFTQNAKRIESRPISLSTNFSDKLSDNGKKLLAGINDSPDGTGLKRTYDQVVQSLKKLVPQAETIKKQSFTTSPSVGFLAGNIVKPFSLNIVTTASDVGLATDPAPDGPPMTKLPNTHANYKPIGVGDLLVVKQQLLRYEAGEISNIQNILKGESLKRSVGRSETIETTVTTESETTKEEERDQQSTDRFELQSQTQNVIESDSTKTSGSTSSDAYGSLVESMSNQNTTTNAVTHSQEVVNRAASKVTERTKKQVVTRTLQQFTEKNTHGFDNAVAGAKNETGIYQWVDKIYQSQVYNYGKRLFYDLVIPEPADFYIQATAQKMLKGLNASRPDPFDIQYDQVSEYNYAYYAGKYNVTAIEPPPVYIKTVSRTFSNKDIASGANDLKAELVPIPAGYAAYSATTAYAFISSWGPGAFFEITLGTTWMQIVNFGVNSVGLNLETDTLPVIFVASPPVNAYTITMEITCTRTDDNLRKWQARMFAVILQAYQQKQAAYQEQLANIVTILRSAQYGQNTLRNRLCERTELKKHCIAMFTQQKYDTFNAIDISSQGYEEPDFAAADIQADYIRFFEQAIEWEQMTYYFYPYFWGRKNHWIDKLGIDDSDQQFADFLRAGAARALLPVRPGFERALIFFLNSGTIPSKDDLDNITSPLYVPVLEEIKEVENGMSMDPVPVGDPWEVRLPTTLVVLRKDDTLPEWGEVDGKWVPLN